MNEPLVKLERLARAKRDDAMRDADLHRLGRQARGDRGARYRLAQGLVFLATRLSPAHRRWWRDQAGAAPEAASRGRRTLERRC